MCHPTTNLAIHNPAQWEGHQRGGSNDRDNSDSNLAVVEGESDKGWRENLDPFKHKLGTQKKQNRIKSMQNMASSESPPTWDEKAAIFHHF